MLTEIAAVILAISLVGAILVSSTRTARRSYSRLVGGLTCCALICIGLDVSAWIARDLAAAVLLLTSAAVLLGLGWQQSARLRAELPASRARHLQARQAHDALRRGHHHR